MNRDFRRFLIVRTDRIGDVILTLPMARVVKSHFPDAHVSMLIRHYTAELVEDCADVDEAIFADESDGTPLGFFHFTALVRAQNYDAVFHTHPRFLLALMTWLARIPVRVGTGYRWYSFLFNRRVFEHRKNALHHELEYNVHLLQAVGVQMDGQYPVPQLRLHHSACQNIQEILVRLGIRPEHQIVLIHPGSGGSARDWSPDKFGELASQLKQKTDVRVILTGRQQEHELLEKVEQAAGQGILRIPREISLREFTALAKRASVFIANSTGPLHIAAAVGTPVIGLFPQVTPLNSTRWGPYTKNKVIFSPAGKPLDCRKCIRNGPCECMDSIAVHNVYDAAVRFLSDKGK